MNKYSEKLQEVLKILNGFTYWEAKEFLSIIEAAIKDATLSTDKINVKKYL